MLQLFNYNIQFSLFSLNNSVLLCFEAFMGGNPLEETVLNIGQHYYLQYYLKLETEELSNFCREASLLKIMKFNHSIVERII